jgi:phosphoribosyl 1,2-cyclic phosphate phosphodiesterase
LVVEQLQGRWRVRDAKLAPLCDEALKGLTRFAHWSARHVPRAQNGRADALANEALDRALRGGPAWVARRPQDATSVTRPSAAVSESSATASTRITVLGSGASRGVPRVGCRCGVCLSRDQRNRRLRSSVLVEWLDGVTERGVIIDPGMDLREQALRHSITRLDGALVTHIHVDHTGGIDELRAYTDAQDAVLPIGAGEATADELRKRWEYAVDGRTAPGAGIPALQLVASDREVTIAGRSFQAIPIVHGKRPAHGWRSGGFAYLTDVSSVTAASRNLLGDLDLLIVSALRDLPHPTHQTVDEALELIRAVGPRRALLTHLDHDLDFEDLAARLPAGVAPAFDGLVVEVPAR